MTSLLLYVLCCLEYHMRMGKLQQPCAHEVRLRLPHLIALVDQGQDNVRDDVRHVAQRCARYADHAGILQRQLDNRCDMSTK